MAHHLFVQTNDPAGNQVRNYERAQDGALTLVETVDAGGNGGRNEGAVVDPLSSQDALVYRRHHHLVVAVNAGSNTVSVLKLADGRLQLRQVLPSGGRFPVSVALHDELLYVLNAHEAGALTGYRFAVGEFHPIVGSTRCLGLSPATGPGQFLGTPAQISFTPDGGALVITTKANQGRIDVYPVNSFGQPANAATANPSGTDVPFGFTVDEAGHLVVTDAATSTLTTYTLNPDGTTEQLASASDGQAAMCWIARAARNFYVANAGSDTVTGFHIDPAGVPTVFTQTATREGPIDLVGTSDGHFLYVQVGGAGGVDGFRIEPDGSLHRVVTLSGLDGLEGIAAT